MVTFKEYSNAAIDQAGRKLLEETLTFSERRECVKVVENWRALHANPLVAFVLYLRKNVAQFDKDAIVVQRLKRMSSILGKLKRSTTRLSRMQDIGGCRVIVKDITSVYGLRDTMLSAQRAHELVKENDYIHTPKSSGYRGIHLIYKYHTQKKMDYNDTFVEVQIRTKLQHLWATSVEAVDTYCGESLKAGQGSEEWKEFFLYVSALFAIEENQPIPQGVDTNHLGRRVAQMCTELNLIDRLKAFNVATKNVVGKKAKYFVLVLSYDEKKLMIYGFESIAEANNLYAVYEASPDSRDNAVLVSASSIKILRKAYPNYYMDIKSFVNKLEEIIKKNQ